MCVIWCHQCALQHTRQHTATHCNTLQHTATHGNTRQHSATHCNTLQHTATLFERFLSQIAGATNIYSLYLSYPHLLVSVSVCCSVLQCVAVCTVCCSLYFPGRNLASSRNAKKYLGTKRGRSGWQQVVAPSNSVVARIKL